MSRLAPIKYISFTSIQSPAWVTRSSSKVYPTHRFASSMPPAPLPPLPDFDKTATFHWTEPPQSGWKIGDPITVTEEGREWMQGEKSGWTVINPASTDVKLYPLMTSAVVPRPIGFVTSTSEDGVHNLAPFSWFNNIMADPPLVSVSIQAPRIDQKKDTARNILATKEFTVSIISEPFVRQANACSLDAPPHVSEFITSGLTPVPSEVIKPPRVKESAFSMECTVYHVMPIIHPETQIERATMVVGLVKRIHVRNDMLTDKGTLDLVKFRPVGRAGDITFTRTTAGFRLPRPKWKEDGVEQVYKELLKTKPTK